MNFNLKNQQTFQAANAEFASESRKLSYSSPVLQDYGSINLLTQGNNGTVADTSNGASKT